MSQSDRAVRPDLQAIANLVAEESLVLDLGCDDGTLLAYLEARMRVRGRGIELHEANVMECVRRGLSVRQGNLNEGLADYPDQSMDYVVLSQTLHYLNHPKHILDEMLRVGRKAIISLPNWGHWRARLTLLTTGHMPEGPILPEPWHAERRWQAVTLTDFRQLCRQRRITIENAIYLSGRHARVSARWANLRAVTGIFVLQRKPPDP